MATEQNGTMRFTLDVGLLSRHMLTDIKNICWTHKVEVKIEALDNGWLSRTYGIEIKGPEGKLEVLNTLIKNKIAQWNDYA